MRTLTNLTKLFLWAAIPALAAGAAMFVFTYALLKLT